MGTTGGGGWGGVCGAFRGASSFEIISGGVLVVQWYRLVVNFDRHFGPAAMVDAVVVHFRRVRGLAFHGMFFPVFFRGFVSAFDLVLVFF